MDRTMDSEPDPETGLASDRSSRPADETGRRALLGVIAVLVVAGVALLAFTGDTDDTGGTDDATADGGVSASELPTAPFERFDGGEATFADFEGKPVVLNFWASWCPACVAELPEFEAVHRDLGDDVTFVGMANADLRGNAVAMADDIGLSYTLVDDPEGVFFAEFDLISMPSTVFITPDGRVHERFGGVLNETLLRQKIDELIAAS